MIVVIDIGGLVGYSHLTQPGRVAVQYPIRTETVVRGAADVVGGQ
jgi:hypothetical protein